MAGRQGGTQIIAGVARRALLAGLAMFACGLSVATGVALGLGASPAGAAPQVLTPVTQSVLSPPRWYHGDDGRFHLKYELELTNTISLPVTVTDIKVLRRGGGGVATLSGGRLEATMSLVGTSSGPTSVLPPSTVGIAWIDLSFRNRNRIPRRIRHRLTIDLGPGLPVGPLITSTGADVSVASKPATEIGPPLRGGPWVAIIGAHRRALQPINGALHLGQRFAVDFAALLDDGARTHVADPNLVASYFNYGQPVLVVGAAKVVAAVDRYPNQVPNDPIPVSGTAANGNYVILRLSKHVFAAYAHLRPGSVRVDRGDRVREGQVIGKLGNTGRTEGPHLHFQMMTRPTILDSDGLPFVIDRFKLNGRTPSLPAFIEADAAEPPVPPILIDRTARGRFRDRGFTDRDLVTFSD